MSQATLRAAIKARLDALGSGIGRVHDYERWANNPADFLKLFQDPGSCKVFGWEILRPSFRIRKVAMSKWSLIHQFTVRGYYALQDAAATEKAVNELVDLIVFDLTLSPLAGAEKDQLPSGTVETRIFGSVLCHVAEIRLPDVAEVVKPAESEVDLTAVGLNYYLQDPEDDEKIDASDEIDLSAQPT